MPIDTPECIYEWVIEYLDSTRPGDIEILDCEAWGDLGDALRRMDALEPLPRRLGLCRRNIVEVEDEDDRAYAYVQGGELSAWFEGGDLVPEPLMKIFSEKARHFKLCR